MTTIIQLNPDSINSLDLTSATQVIDAWLQAGQVAQLEPQLQFAIDYPRGEEENLELSEIPEVRLWFIRLDARYPWLPYVLDWRTGELARYIAMLVPHQFNPKEGIVFNPQALDILVMHKVFILHDWLKRQGIAGEGKLKQFAEMFGYDLDEDLFKLL